MANPPDDAERVSGWLRDLGSDDPVVAEAAEQGLVDAGPAAVSRLIDLLDVDEDRLRSRVISLLSLLGHPRLASPLAGLLHDASPSIRSRAAAALARIPSAASVAALRSLLRREPVESVRYVAARALLRLLRAGQDEALDPLLRILSHRDEAPRVRLAALGALPWISRVGNSDVISTRAILERLAGDAEPRVAAKARRLLSSPSRVRLEPQTVSRLLEDLGRRRLSVWRRAVAILGAAGSSVIEPVIHAMQHHAGDGEYARRCGLILRSLSPRQLCRLAPHLDELDEPTCLETLVDVAAEAGSRMLLARLSALIDRIAASSGAEGPGTLHGVRCRAHVALARAGSRLAVADLRKLLDDPRFPVEPQLAEAAAAVGTRAELPSLFRAYLRSRGVTRLAVRDAVGVLVRREKVRRTDRWIARLDPPERRAATEILGPPRMGKRRETLGSVRIDRATDSLLT